MTSGELAIPGGVFMAGGGPGGVVGGVRSAYGLLTRPNFGRVASLLVSSPLVETCHLHHISDVNWMELLPQRARARDRVALLKLGKMIL
jgi:hypothetical protein